MAGIGDHISGKHVKMTFRQNNKPIIIRAEVQDVEEVAEEFVDQVNGEDRGRPGIITDFYQIRISAYVQSLDLLRSWIDDTANDDAHVAPLKKSLAIRIDLLDGTSGAFTFTDCSRGPWKLGIPGRKQRVKKEVTIKARWLKEAKAV